ncbi:unnamed protein product, partial [Prorocentrum cordatum]
VHVRGVPSSCSLPDVAALLAGGGAGAPFCYRVSDGVVAAELESASAVEAAIALTGRVLAPPQTGHVRFPGEAERRARAEATAALPPGPGQRQPCTTTERQRGLGGPSGCRAAAPASGARRGRDRGAGVPRRLSSGGAPPLPPRRRGQAEGGGGGGGGGALPRPNLGGQGGSPSIRRAPFLFGGGTLRERSERLSLLPCSVPDASSHFFRGTMRSPGVKKFP